MSICARRAQSRRGFTFSIATYWLEFPLITQGRDETPLPCRGSKVAVGLPTEYKESALMASIKMAPNYSALSAPCLTPEFHSGTVRAYAVPVCPHSDFLLRDF